MLAIDHKVPKVLTLKQMIQKYVEFQDEIVRRRTQYDLKKAKERAHILEGLKKADLERMANDMGLDISKAKTKADLIAAITAAEVYAPAEDENGGAL